MITITVKAAVIIPTVPNYLLAKEGDRKFPLTAFDENTLREIGKAWTDALIARANEMKLSEYRNRAQWGAE